MTFADICGISASSSCGARARVLAGGVISNTRPSSQIHVVPPSRTASAVITRAREILSALEHDELARGGRPSVSGTPSEPQRQLGLFRSAPPHDALRDKIAALDVDRLTPLEALAFLADVKKDL